MAFSEKRYLNRLKFELKRRGLSDEILKDVVEAFDSARECGESPEAVAERLGTPAAFAESFGGSKVRSVHVFAIISAVFIIIGIVLTVAMSLSNGVPSDAIGFAESGTNIYLNGSSVPGILLRILPFALAALFALTEVTVTILTLRKRKTKMKKYKILIVCMILFALTVLLLSVSACTDDRITIEDYSWRFDTAVSGGKVAFVSEDNATAYPEATVVDGVLRAKDGELRAEFNGKVYSGTYSVFDRAPEAVNYNVKLFAAEQSEYAVVAFTEYSDGTAAPTLVLSLPGEDGYAVYFTGFKEQ